MGRVLARSSGKKGQGWRPPQGCGVWGGERRREGVARQKGRGAPPLARTGSSPLPTQAEGGGRPLVGCTHRRAGRVVGRQPTEHCSCICSYRFYPRSAVAPLARVSHGYPKHHQPRVRSNTVQEDYATLHCYQSPACLTTCRRSRRSPTGVMPAREPARTPAQSLSPPGGDRCDPGRPGGGERGQGRWRRVTSVGGGKCGRLGAGSAGNGGAAAGAAGTLRPILPVLCTLWTVSSPSTPFPFSPSFASCCGLRPPRHHEWLGPTHNVIATTGGGGLTLPWTGNHHWR